ncbi:hypothetical protein ACFLRI_02775 [Bacteroidota bacterium]
MRQLPGYILVLLISISSTAFYSCKNYDLNAEIRQADSLIALVEQASETLVIENEYVRQRIDSMKIKLDFISRLDSNRMNAEFRFDVTRYRALFRNYKDFIIEYEALIYDNEVYHNYCKELKKSLVDKQVSAASFKEIYVVKRNEIKGHLNECKILVKSLVSTENMYQRLNVKIIDFYMKETGSS